MCKLQSKYIALLLFVFASHALFGQNPLRINKVISPNQIARYNGQGLILLDFWATWCAPCVPATKQLEFLQERHKDNLFIVSISDEEENVITSFLQRKPIKLAVIQDLQGNLIKNFNVHRRPHAVLLNANGSILYEGHPANITDAMIDKLSAKNRNNAATKWHHLFAASKGSQTNQNKTFTIERTNDLTQSQYTEDGIFHYSGAISELIKYLTGYSFYQLDFDGISDFGITLSCPQEQLSNTSLLLSQVSNKLSIRLQKAQTIITVTTLSTTTSSRLWDKNQIEWNNGSAHSYILSTDRIEADNMSLKQIAGLLSDIKGRPFYYKGTDDTAYDWNFHFLYDNLLKEDLEQTFGLQLGSEKLTMPAYIIMPK